jgi:hypothetical protein
MSKAEVKAYESKRRRERVELKADGGYVKGALRRSIFFLTSLTFLASHS